MSNQCWQPLPFLFFLQTLPLSTLKWNICICFHSWTVFTDHQFHCSAQRSIVFFDDFSFTGLHTILLNFGCIYNYLLAYLIWFYLVSNILSWRLRDKNISWVTSTDVDVLYFCNYVVQNNFKVYFYFFNSWLQKCGTRETYFSVFSRTSYYWFLI